MTSREPMEAPELNRRLLFALLRPAVRLARRFRMPLKTFEEVCRLAYFEETRRKGEVSQADVAQAMEKSLRTIGSLERQYRGDFLAPKSEVEVSRKVEAAFELGPRSVEAVAEQLELDEGLTLKVIQALALTGRLVEVDDGIFEQNREFISLYRNEIKTRIDGLQHQMEIISDAVQSRFLEPKRYAVARSLSFVSTDQGLERLAQVLIKFFRDECSETEEDALKRGDFKSVSATFALTEIETE